MSNKTAPAHTHQRSLVTSGPWVTHFLIWERPRAATRTELGRPGLLVHALRTMTGSGESRSLDDLLVQAAAGNRNAFAALYDEVAPRLYDLALRIVDDWVHRGDSAASQAQLIAEEALLMSWRYSARFDPDRHEALPWLATILRGVAAARRPRT